MAQLDADFHDSLALMEFVVSADRADISAVMGQYGISVVDGNADEIEDCPQYFSEPLRSAWHRFDGENYFVESAGRPERAYGYFPPAKPAPRRAFCQRKVGHWGDLENTDSDYDGGHLIAANLGGWGGRANLIPQHMNFNRGNWAQLEKHLAYCSALPLEQMFYYIRVEYEDEDALIPSTMIMSLENRNTRDSISLQFLNERHGGADGRAEREKGVAFLEANGCVK